MDERASGIVLRVRPLTETSLIVNWLTPDCGRVGTVAKGARRPKSPFTGKLDLYFQADFSFQRARRSDLHALREVVLNDTHPGLRRDFRWLQQAAYAASLIELTTEPETPLPEFYALFAGFLDYLPRQPAGPVGILAWEMKLLSASGLRPNMTDSPLLPGTRRLLEMTAETDWPAVGCLKLSAAQAGEMARFLGAHLAESFGKIPCLRPETLSAAILGG